MSSTMKACVFAGRRKVEVKEVPKPKIEHVDDAILKITSTCICGSDLHMYNGRTAAQPGLVLGHENMGIVEEVGPGCTLVKKGDRVVVPFNVACGRCENCREKKSAFCLAVNPGFAGGAYGYVAMGPFMGGQAQYLRVPFADFAALKLPAGTEHEEDFVLLSDIAPTGWDGVMKSGFRAGETIAIYGAGPVGAMAALSAKVMGASKIFVVDNVDYRLEKLAEIGAIPIDFSKVDPVKEIVRQTGGDGTDRGVDCVGNEAKSFDGKGNEPAAVINALIYTVRATGGIGNVGVYFPVDPGAPDPDAAKGTFKIHFGKLWEKGLSFEQGQCNVNRYNKQIRDLIIEGKMKPSWYVSHIHSLDDAPTAYNKFDDRVDGYRKVILKPNPDV